MIVAEACLRFCVSEPNRDLAGELFVFRARGLLCSVQRWGRGRKGMWASPAAAPWELRAGQSRVICVDSGLPLSHPVLIPLRKLCCGTLQPYSSVHCFITNHPMSFFVISLVFFTRKVAVQFKGTLVQGNNRTGDRQCCFSEIVLAGLLLDNLIR